MSAKSIIPEKNKPIFCNSEFFCEFEELYYFPLSFFEIAQALEQARLTKKYPIIKIFIKLPASYSLVESIIESVIEYNSSIKWNDLVVEVKLYSSINEVQIIQWIKYLEYRHKIKIIIVTNVSQNYKSYISEINKASFEHLSLLRVNVKDNMLITGQVSSINAFTLMRVYLHSGIDLIKQYQAAVLLGFDGIQLTTRLQGEIPSHSTSNNIMIDIANLSSCDTKIKLFLDNDLTKLTHPRYCINPKIQKRCISSLLMLTIEDNTVKNCPYNKSIQEIRIHNSNWLSRRNAIDTQSEGCNDCGYVSDNMLYLKLIDAFSKGYTISDFS